MSTTVLAILFISYLVFKWLKGSIWWFWLYFQIGCEKGGMNPKSQRNIDWSSIEVQVSGNAPNHVDLVLWVPNRFIMHVQRMNNQLIQPEGWPSKFLLQLLISDLVLHFQLKTLLVVDKILWLRYTWNPVEFLNFSTRLCLCLLDNLLVDFFTAPIAHTKRANYFFKFSDI